MSSSCRPFWSRRAVKLRLHYLVWKGLQMNLFPAPARVRPLICCCTGPAARTPPPLARPWPLCRREPMPVSRIADGFAGALRLQSGPWLSQTTHCSVWSCITVREGTFRVSMTASRETMRMTKKSCVPITAKGRQNAVIAAGEEPSTDSGSGVAKIGMGRKALGQRDDLDLKPLDAQHLANLLTDPRR
jgi:hypothetical protein